MYRKKEVKKEKINDFSSSKTTYEKLKKDYNISQEDLEKFYKIKQFFDKLTPQIIEDLEEKEYKIPLSIFSKRLSALETIVKYLRENLDLSYKEIAELTKRSEKTIWQAHNSSKKKLPSEFKIEFSKYYLPISILSNRRLSVLENIVGYLHEDFKLNYSEIARLLHRDSRTIWTVYSRAKKKYDKTK